MSRVARVGAVVVLAVVGTSGWASPPASALSDSAVISGTVYSSDGVTPLEGVHLESPDVDHYFSAVTDSQGKYEIAGLNPGTYRLSGNPLDAPARDQHILTAGPTVTLEEGEHREGVDFSMTGFTPVSGSLIREEPVEGDITKFGMTFVGLHDGDEDQVVVTKRTSPDSSGNYSLTLPPGRYIVRAAPPRDASGGYTTSYYPKWWEDVYGEYDEDPQGAILAGARILTVAATPISLDMEIDRGGRFTVAPAPTLEGTAHVGSSLFARTDGWVPQPDGFTYEWRRDGVVIPNTGGPEHQLGDADFGKSISVVVTAEKDAYFPRSAESTAVVVTSGPPIARRIDAPDRYTESVAISQELTLSPTSLVYVASGETYADALSASAIVAAHDARLLLSTSTQVPDVVADEIDRLQPDRIVVLGGTATLKPDVVAQLQALIPDAVITRIGGADRFDTSRRLIADPTFGAPDSTSIYVASGLTFPDALSATSPAAREGAPILLVNGGASALNDSEKQLLDDRGVQDVTIVGGDLAVSSGLEGDLTQLYEDVVRVGGTDRFAVSAELARRAFTNPIPIYSVYIATGANYPDALVGGVLAARQGAPVFLSRDSCLPPVVAEQILALGAHNMVLLGGPKVLKQSVADFAICT